MSVFLQILGFNVKSKMYCFAVRNRHPTFKRQILKTHFRRRCTPIVSLGLSGLGEPPGSIILLLFSPPEMAQSLSCALCLLPGPACFLDHLPCTESRIQTVVPCGCTSLGRPVLYTPCVYVAAVYCGPLGCPYPARLHSREYSRRGLVGGDASYFGRGPEGTA